MNTGTTIQTADRYRSQLPGLVNRIQDDTAEYHLASWAFSNESDIIQATNQIHSIIGLMTQRLEQANCNLDANHPDCLNPRGILQNLNGDLDSAVVKLNFMVKQRDFYNHLLQNAGQTRA